MKFVAFAMSSIAMMVVCAVAGSAQEQDPNDESIDEPAVYHELITELVVEPERYRAFVKQAMEGHLGAMGMIVTQRTPLVQHMVIHARAMQSLAEMHKAIYASGTGTDNAAPGIWTEPEAFAYLQDDFAIKVAELVAATEQGNRHAILGKLMQLGDRCEICHKTFRISGE